MIIVIVIYGALKSKLELLDIEPKRAIRLINDLTLTDKFDLIKLRRDLV